VLSTLKMGQPLRFRCQVGHAFAADALAREQEGQVDEAMRVALRIIEERAGRGGPHVRRASHRISAICRDDPPRHVTIPGSRAREIGQSG